jgi:hypothetical protein
LVILLLTQGIFPREKKKNLWIDIALTGGVTFAYVLIIEDLRKKIFTHYSLCQVVDNFKDPINRAIEGGKTDSSHFLTNYVGHPLSFAGLALYLKARGYSNLESILFTQTHSIIWEYVIEGGVWYPSGKDLITDFIGAMAGIYLLHPLSDLGEKKRKSGKRTWFYDLLYFLNPFKEINTLLFGKNSHATTLFIAPCANGLSLSLVHMF